MIVIYQGKNRVIEYKSDQYPGSKENPYYFGVPIWMNNNQELEIRRAGGENMLIKNTVKFNGYNEKQLKEIKKSCSDFLDFMLNLYKEYEEPKGRKESKEIKKYRDIVANFNNHSLEYLG